MCFVSLVVFRTCRLPRRCYVSLIHVTSPNQVLHYDFPCIQKQLKSSKQHLLFGIRQLITSWVLMSGIQSFACS